MESLEVSEIDKKLPDTLSPYFEGFMKVLPCNLSFYASLSYTLLQSIIIHKISDQGTKFITSLKSLIEKAKTSSGELDYLQMLIEHISSSNQYDKGDLTENLKTTVGALAKLSSCLSLIYNYISEEQSTNLSPVSFKYNKPQLSRLMRILGVAAVIVYKNEIEYLNQEPGRIMLWMHQEGETWSMLIPKKTKGYPYYYQELKENAVNQKESIEKQIYIDRNQVQASDVETDQYLVFNLKDNEVIKIQEPVEIFIEDYKHLRDYTHYLATFPENLSFYSGFIISLLSSIQKSPKSEKFRQFEILNEIITQAPLVETKVYLKFFRKFLYSIKNSTEPIDIIQYLKFNSATLLYLTYGLSSILNYLLNSTSFNFYLIIPEKHKNLLENACKVLEIKLFLATSSTLHTFGLASNSLSVSLMEHNNIFYCLILKTPIQVLKQKKLNKAVETLWESLSSSTDITMTYEIQINLQMYVNDNNIILSDPLASKTKISNCSIHKDQKCVYITECHHAICISCLASEFTTQFSCKICNKPLSKSIYPKLLQALDPLESLLRTTPNKLTCTVCHNLQPLQHFQAISCPKNCKICFKCRIKSRSQACSCCKIPYELYQKEILASIAENLSYKNASKGNMVCIMCFKVVNQDLKNCCDVCDYCNFDSINCLVCDVAIQRKAMNCDKCQREIQKKLDMICCNQCTSRYHLNCFDFNNDECERCMLKRYMK